MKVCSLLNLLPMSRNNERKKSTSCIGKISIITTRVDHIFDFVKLAVQFRAIPEQSFEPIPTSLRQYGGDSILGDFESSFGGGDKSSVHFF